MIIKKNIHDFREYIEKARGQFKKIGFVPTMGSLHEGHLSLVKKAVWENDLVVVSIFVNPTQFGPEEDFDRYPRDIKGDIEQLEELDTDIVFCPDSSEMYSADYNTYVQVNGIAEKLCGRSRSGHFQGVATVLTKFFNIIHPDKVYFGNKDYQQLLVVKKLVEDLNFSIEIIGLPIVREADGLAFSSRNKYLSKEGRNQAVVLYHTLMKIKKNVCEKKFYNLFKLKEMVVEMITSKPLAEIDYVEFVDPDTLDEVPVFNGNLLVALAVYIEETRLIDNIIIRDYKPI